MIKAIMLDHMGTLVHESSEYLDELLKECVKNCPVKDPKKIFGYWFHKHDELLKQYNGENYKTEYQIAKETFDEIKAEFGLTGDSADYADMLIEHWVHAPAFDDAYDFFDKCQLPIYILTNNDTKYVEESMHNLKLKPQGIISSETTHYYKPAKEMFMKALDIIGLKANEVIYIGDSLGKDILAAQELGIQTYYIGKGKVDDSSVNVIETLLDIFKKI